jgi:hypothetical protein
MEENKVYESKSKLWLWGSIEGIVIYAVIMGMYINRVMNSDVYKDNVFFWIYMAVASLYILFAIAHLFPRKVELFEDESARITFFLGDSVKLKPGKFRIKKFKSKSEKWGGFIFVRGRFVLFYSHSFSELKKYLIR